MRPPFRRNDAVPAQRSISDRGPSYFKSVESVRRRSLSSTPPPFYECEVLFTDTEPVGLLFVYAIEVTYVSPMVVSHLVRDRRSVKDVNRIECNGWIPLYKNRDTWRSFGIKWYASNLQHHKRLLYRVFAWLRNQTVEKYRLLYQDLQHVAHILLGEDESRWFLRTL